ncbi:MAG: ribonuclease HII [Armatimonadota bacterium]
MGQVTDLFKYEHEAQQSGHAEIAGVDEAGRGPLAGPVVAAAVILPKDFDLTGIRDSKKLSEAQRERAYTRITADAKAVGVGIISSEIIDKINILQATYEAMRAALKDMGAAFDFVLVDGDHTIPDLGVEQSAIIEGDSKSASVAAASIVAKVTRDCIMREMAKVYPNYGFEKHKGYCTQAHLQAIEEHGACAIHRKSFSPVARKVNGDCPQKSLF